MAEPQDISCPRCGYDLAGAHAARGDVLLAEGTCSECGLRFSWEEIESGRLNVPRFYFEHAPSVVSMPIRFFRTLGRALTGSRLWGPLKMVHEIREGRLLVFALLCVVLMHVMCAGLTLGAARFGYVQNWYPQAVGGYVIPGIGGLPLVRRRPAPIPPPPTVLFVYQGIPVGWSDLPPLIAWPYDKDPMFDVFGVRIGASLELGEMTPALVAMLGPAALIVGLRQTRRQFRVRKVHIWRALCLGVPVVFGVFVLAEVSASVAANFLNPSEWGPPRFIKLAAVGCSVFLVLMTLWWWCFCRRYLRAPHALGIAIAGSILGMLASAFVGLVCEARWLHAMLT